MTRWGWGQAKQKYFNMLIKGKEKGKRKIMKKNKHPGMKLTPCRKFPQFRRILGIQSSQYQ